VIKARGHYGAGLSRVLGSGTLLWTKGTGSAVP